MSEESDLERTEPASQKRLEEARTEGQVPRSQELSTFVVLIVAGAGLWLMGGYLARRLMGMMGSGMKVPRSAGFDPALLLERLLEQSLYTLAALTPFLLLMLIAALAAPMLLSGWLFTWKSLAPDFKRINPLKGVGRMFSMHSLVELAKALLKASLIGAVAVWTIWRHKEAVLSLIAAPVGTGIGHLGELILLSFLAIAATMVLVAAVDVPFKLWDHARKLRMTKEEVRQENKETEGNPQVKSRIRAQQHAMARKRMMAEIPTADVIVTNPIRFAVALRYEEGKMRAPRVVAKGQHLLAARIRETGERHGVPLLEAPPLARALYHHAGLGDEIPRALYDAVAEVLAYVYRLRRAREQGGPVPVRPDALPVPAGLDPEGADAGAADAGGSGR